ncbi:hypothetical protein AGLY_010626 [Aphis glycines]|uniref:Uncharacterized protein n=1 Tax=Aphis glycines TaxID=307491 RepID=A0A6G0TFE6_APHGL|nr:hypothetical protein AGLY_010626 [Aphis glycines]
MYSYNFLITIRRTLYKICNIYDLYFLNNNKYQKLFEVKPLFNAVLKIYGEPYTKFSKLSYKRKTFYDFSTSKLLANFRVFDRFLTKKKQLTRNLVLNFQNFLVIQEFFIDTLKKISQKNRKFQWSINNSKKFLKYNHKKKIDLVENWFCVKIVVFLSFFFLFFSIFLKTVGKC